MNEIENPPDIFKMKNKDFKLENTHCTCSADQISMCIKGRRDYKIQIEKGKSTSIKTERKQHKI